MRNIKISFAAFGVATVLLIGWFTWTAVIAPKDTRLRFYEILTEAKNIKYSNFEKTDLTSSWLSELNHMDLNHLKPCEKIQYHNTKAQFEQFVGHKDIAPNSLQAVSRKYSTDRMTLEEISKIGEDEFNDVLAELQLLETHYHNPGVGLSLDELSKHPENYRTDPNDVENIYKTLIAKAEQNLASRFYDYDIPKGTAEVVMKRHRFSAYASYNERYNLLTAYFDEASYDVSIAAFISVHEIFPGHHLNMKSRSSGFRCPGDNPKRTGWLLEGWATYAEFIADEEGFFDEPEHKLAWLDYRLIRAMRIILDVERMKDQTEYDDLKEIWHQRMPKRLKPRFDRELSRIVNSNHQHLSYILGYQAIIRTKTKLMNDLGANFDEKAFHDAMLRIDHRHPKILYETTKIAMEFPDLPARKETVLAK